MTFTLHRKSIISVGLLAVSLVSMFPTKAAFAQDAFEAGKAQENKSEGSSGPETGNDPASAPDTGTTAAPKETVNSLVESQKGCRIVIIGLPPLKNKQSVSLRKNDGSALSATVVSSQNAKTIALLNGPACKQNVKGWRAEVPLDPNIQPLQVRGPLVFEPESSGWYRAKRPNSYVIGFGAGYQLNGLPLYRLQFGWMDSLVGFALNYEIGASSSDALKISGSRSVNWYLFAGNSLFLDFGYGSETRSAVFTPKVIANGEIRNGMLASGNSDLGFVHLGFGNKWQWGGFGVSVEWFGARGIVSRTDEINATELVTTTSADGSVLLESRKITDENSIAINKEILRRKVGEGGSYRLMFTTLSYSF